MKHPHEDKINYQSIVFDKKGTVIISTDTLFELPLLNERPGIDDFPFVKSIFNDLMHLPTGQPTQFHKVESDHPSLPGKYDFLFIKITSVTTAESTLIWTIFDLTKEYEVIQNQQQKEKVRSILNE